MELGTQNADIDYDWIPKEAIKEMSEYLQIWRLKSVFFFWLILVVYRCYVSLHGVCVAYGNMRVCAFLSPAKTFHAHAMLYLLSLPVIYAY